MSSNRNLKKLITLQILLKLKNIKEAELKKRRSRKVFWVSPFLLNRNEHDLETTLLKDLELGSGSNFKNFTRMSIDQFEELLSHIAPAIQKQDTIMRQAITARTKLAITLRFLASGDSYRSLEFLSRVSYKTISAFVPEVLQAIWEVLQPKVPRTEEEWMKIAEDFNKLWQFPHTLGAVDGKHIRVKAPPNSGSNFYCYKGFYSIVLFAVVDANGKFIYIDVGANGRVNDSTIYKDSPFYNALLDGSLNIPSPTNLPGQNIATSYFYIGDDAFALSANMLKPFNRNIALTLPEKVFNYRVCRPRMIAECAFGRLAQRFRILMRAIETKLETADLIVKACCALHNHLTKEVCEVPREDEIFQVNRSAFDEIGQQYIENNRLASKTRENVMNYVMSNGVIDSQWSKIN